VNGLPLGVIECKSPYITNPLEAGINQLLRYANRRQPQDLEGAERLFWYNQVMVSTHRDSACVGTISSHMEHYLEWKDPYPKKAADLGDNQHSQRILISGVFTPKNFLDLIQNFTLYETVDGRTIKKIAPLPTVPSRPQDNRTIEDGRYPKREGWRYLAHPGFRKISDNGLAGGEAAQRP
jgi:type I restriction enzyme R subunit